MTNSHAGRDSVRIDDHVRHDSLSSKWQVLLSVGHATSSFLTVTTGKLVSNLRDSNSSHFDFGESEILFISSDYNLINNAALRVLQGCGAVLEPSQVSFDLTLIETRC